ncbi:MAG TPA: gliding motility-associated C-terminal domain-containing protein [Chitinophagaceae bacterium]|nr:gliding motility-associated C-terminal domain-containing protein [Chitinophagaceae bacterium]
MHNHDTTIYLGDHVQLMASGAPFYYWTPTTYLTYSQSNSPIATPLEDITYTVTGVSILQGCPQTASVNIKVVQPDVVLPNAFTPNGDGVNDIFRVVGRNFINLQEFKIFNRWGVELFSTSDINKGWDGTYKGVPQDPGVYFYQIRVAYPNGKTQNLKGDVTLIR